MKFIGVIPARYASTRFPGKPLAILGGKTVIQRVYEQVSSVLKEAYVATDDDKIFNTVKQFGGKVVKFNGDKSVIEIRNRLQVGDELEIIIPNKIEPYKFKIENLWDAETEEEIEAVNPGKQGQRVLMKLPIECEKDWIIRKKK